MDETKMRGAGSNKIRKKKQEKVHKNCVCEHNCVCVCAYVCICLSVCVFMWVHKCVCTDAHKCQRTIFGVFVSSYVLFHLRKDLSQAWDTGCSLSGQPKSAMDPFTSVFSLFNDKHVLIFLVFKICILEIKFWVPYLQTKRFSD